MKKILLFTFVMALASVVAVGCGSSKKKKKKKSGTTTEQTVSLEMTGSGKSVKLTAPGSTKAGLTKITFKNSTKKDASAQLVKVDGNQSVEEVIKVGDSWGDKGTPLPDWFTLQGGPSAAPGQTGTVTKNLAPGKYYAIDIDSDASAPIEVTGSQASGQPTAGPTVDAVEYSFKATGLKTGKQTVLFQNKGKEPHFIVGGPINPGKTIADVKKAVTSEGGPSGPPPFDEKSAFDTTIIEGGETQAVEIDFKKKGKYVLLCFIPDRKGGPPHVVKGMVSEANVD